MRCNICGPSTSKRPSCSHPAYRKQKTRTAHRWRMSCNERASSVDSRLAVGGPEGRNTATHRAGRLPQDAARLPKQRYNTSRAAAARPRITRSPPPPPSPPPVSRLGIVRQRPCLHRQRPGTLDILAAKPGCDTKHSRGQSGVGSKCCESCFILAV